LAVVTSPSILKAQPSEIVIGGAASHKPWVESIVQPFFEKKYNCRTVYEGTRSLVNLEKMQKNKDRQYLSVVQMDDPVMILAVKEELIEKLTPAKVPNLANIRADAVPACGPTIWRPGRASPTTPRCCRTACRRGATCRTQNTRPASSCRRCRTRRVSPTCSWRRTLRRAGR
jgi:hypothetical protein